jgi:adenylate kinase
MCRKFFQVVFLGPPGVGKGTYARRCAPRLGFAHISPGDVLRQAAKNRPELQAVLDRGELVDQGEIFNIMSKHIDEVKRGGHRGVLLDGFPRNVDQAKGWTSEHVPDLVIQFRLPENLLTKKLLGRRVCGNCGDLYNVFSFQNEHYWMPAMLPKIEGKCDQCGHALVNRSDDNMETISKRLEFHTGVEDHLVSHMNNLTSVTKFDVKTGIAQVDELVHLIRHSLAISL